MKNLIKVVIKEYVVDIDGLDYPIRGRICKEKDQDYYYGDLSHYCKPFDEACDIYIPGGLSGKDLNRVETTLINYLQTFNNNAVSENKDF